MRLTLQMVEEAERLLHEGRLSQRKIAKLIGISRSSVHNLARGKRPRLGPKPSDDVPYFSGPLERCPGCGGRVYMPCLLCRVRQIKADERPERREHCGWDQRPLSPLGPASARPSKREGSHGTSPQHRAVVAAPMASSMSNAARSPHCPSA